MYEYLTRKQATEEKKRIIEIIGLVQKDLKGIISFQYHFIGSASRNMITWDRKQNIGYDFDINLSIQSSPDNYSAQKIKQTMMKSFDKFASKYGYDYCEDSTRVFTIKVKDIKNSKILHSCDFAIVKDCNDDDGYYYQQFIKNNKGKNYVWEDQPQAYYDLLDKVAFIKEQEAWNDLRDRYLYKKNKATNQAKKSRSLYAEAVHEICQLYGYYDDDQSTNSDPTSYPTKLVGWSIELS